MTASPRKILLDRKVEKRLNQLYTNIKLTRNKSGRYLALWTIDPVKGRVQVQLMRVIMAVALELKGKRLPAGSWVKFVDPSKPWDMRLTNLKLCTPINGKRRATGIINADISHRKDGLLKELDPDQYLRQLRADYLASKKGDAQ